MNEQPTESSATSKKPGYYVYDNVLTGPNVNVIYTTGIKGGGGHCYWRILGGTPCGVPSPMSKYKNGWTTLLWSCVPGKKRIGAYTYYANCPPGIPDWK